MIEVAEESEANMAYPECRMEVSVPTVAVQGQRKNEHNKGAKVKIIVKFRVLTNICKIERGSVLTVKAETGEPDKSAEPQRKRLKA